MNQRRPRPTRPKAAAQKREQQKLIITILVGAFFISMIYNIVSSQFELARLKEKKRLLTQELATQTQRGRELLDQINQSNDLEYVEYMAKKYLNMVYPDEQKVVIVQPQE